MPGIVGIISQKSSNANSEDLRLMVNCMMHEPTYNSGTYVNEGLSVYVGWISNRGSFSDCMPLVNEKRDLVLIFSGEDFGGKQITNHLKKREHEFDLTNASYLVHLYEEDGEGFLSRLNGWFSGILIDQRQREVILFNDRFGMSRVYYHECEEGIFFASEAKAILRVLPKPREIEMNALGEFFACGAVLNNRTMFSGISILPGGSAWTFCGGRPVERKQYFTCREWEEQQSLEGEPFHDELRETFKRVVPRYFCGPEQAAVSLTGGLDTRMIMAYADKEPGTLPCYTFGGMYRDCFDVKIAREIAKVCRQEYQVIRLGREFLQEFPRLAERTVYVTDGCLDVCASHEIYLNSLAREIAPVRVTGNYGSEVLRSVNYFRANPPAPGLLNADMQRIVEDSSRAFDEPRGGPQLSYAVFNLIPWLLYGRLAAGQSQLVVRTPYMDNDLVGLMYRAPDEVRATKDASLRLIKHGNPVLSGIMTDRGIGDNWNILWSKLGRLHREALFKAEYWYGDGMPNRLVKWDHALRALHPGKLFLGRHKIEQYREWFKNELSEYVRSVLLDEKSLSRPYVDRNGMVAIVNGHIRGNGNYLAGIDRALTAELAQRTLIERG